MLALSGWGWLCWDVERTPTSYIAHGGPEIGVPSDWGSLCQDRLSEQASNFGPRAPAPLMSAAIRGQMVGGLNVSIVTPSCLGLHIDRSCRTRLNLSSPQIPLP